MLMTQFESYVVLMENRKYGHFKGKVVIWPSVERIKPIGRTQSITRETFVEYLMWCKGRITNAMNSRPIRGNFIGAAAFEAKPVVHLR